MIITVRGKFRDNKFLFSAERATSQSNQEPDLLAIDTIVKIIQNDKQLSSFVAQKIKEKVSSSNSKVVLQSLDVKFFIFSNS